MLASPLLYVGMLGRTIDLSQLVEVNDAFFFESDPWANRESPIVGFVYRYASSPEAIMFKRSLIDGPYRNSDLSLCDPSRIMETAGEERFYVSPEKDAGRIAHGGHVVVFEEDEPTKPKALTRMENQVESLKDAWLKWKQAEPEIYAIIRKHLS